MTERSEFTEGRVVRLKSGGPSMVVEDIPAAGKSDVVCVVWFAGEESKRDTFHYLALNLVGHQSVAQMLKPSLATTSAGWLT